MITGAGIASVFWKMPTGTQTHALYEATLIDQHLAASPLPGSALSPEEQPPFDLPYLPTLGDMPLADSGATKYGLTDSTPPALASRNIEQGQFIPPTWESTWDRPKPAEASAILQSLEPIRQIIEEKPLDIEPVDRDFPPGPDFDDLTNLTLPNAILDDKVQDEPVSTSPQPGFASALQPLQPLRFDGLSPLQPLQESELRSFSTLLFQ